MASSAVTAERRKLIEEKSLRQILDGLVIAQRQDIKAFSGGHLNEANLPKPPEQGSSKSWRSAQKPAIRLIPKSSLPSSKKETRNQDTMKDMILSFSIGTSGAVPAKPKPKPTPMPASALSTKSRKLSPKQDGVLVEELNVPGTMLPTSEYPEPKSKLLVTEQVLTDSELSRPPSRHNQLPPLTSSHQFMSSHFDAVTKKDQFQRMKNFESDVIRKQDTTEQNVMSGVKAVEHLEAKLHQDLDNLKYNGYGPNFHRLQVYSDVLEDLIMESPTFGHILHTIKCEYDDYIASLLEGQGSKHQLLHRQVEQLSARGVHSSRQLDRQVAEVKQLEEEGKRMLQENSRLRQELQMEKELLEAPKEEDLTPRSLVAFPMIEEDAPVDLKDQVQHLKASILEKLDEMNKLKTKLRKDCVPTTVCTHLEQCIKETEVEIQKLTSQKEFFERSIADMEEELETAIETADTTEKDARRVWKRITAVKNVVQGPPGAGVTTTGPGGPANGSSGRGYDSDDDDEQKWNWYIS